MRGIQHRLTTCWLLGLAMLAALDGHAAEVYRWTDENGQVHYGERPPTANARRLELPKSDAAAKDAAADSAARRARQQRVLEAYEYQRNQKKAEAARAAQASQRAAARCREMHRRWRSLSFPGPVYFSGPDGGRDYLSDEQRAAEKERMRPAYAQACGEEPPP